MVPANSISPSPSPDIQVRLFKIANQIALKNAQEYQWSTWHPWNVVDDAEANYQFGIRGMDRYFWSLTGRFGSCLGASTRIYTQLQGELAGNPDLGLRPFVNTVQLMTSAQHAATETGYHVVVAMCFDEFAIVIDHAFHPAAFRIPLGGYFDMAPYIPLFGESDRGRFEYFLEDGEHKLTMDNEEYSHSPLYFSVMDVNKATNQLAIPAAEEKQLVKGHDHVLMPCRKYLSIRSLLDKEPRLIAAEPVDGKWLATTMRIQVQFANPEISMQVPNRDWLTCQQGKDWNKRFKNYLLKCADSAQTLQTWVTDEVILLRLPLDAEVQEQPYAELGGLLIMQALGEEFDLKYEVLNEMMWSVYRAWAPYRSKRADSPVDD